MSISCGGKTTKTFNTTNLVYHMKSRHIDLHSEYEKSVTQRRARKKLQVAAGSLHYKKVQTKHKSGVLMILMLPKFTPE